MKVILYTNDPTRNEVLMLNSELKICGHIPEICTPWSIDIPHEKKGLPKADLVYIITPVLFNGSAFELAHRLVTLEEWDKELILINPIMSLLHSTKAHFTNYCDRKGIPHPKTIVTENLKMASDFALSQFNKGCKIVLKPVARGEGVGIKLLQPMDLETTLRYLLWYSSEYGDRVFYLQEFLENFGYDIRLFVINDCVVSRMKRINSFDFRFNLAQGGMAEPFLETEYDELAIISAQSMGAKVAGVDIMPTKNGPIVLEVNIYPGFKGLAIITGINIPKLLIEYFESIT